MLGGRSVAIRSWILDSWILDSGSWILGSWILGFWILYLARALGDGVGGVGFFGPIERSTALQNRAAARNLQLTVNTTPMRQRANEKRRAQQITTDLQPIRSPAHRMGTGHWDEAAALRPGTVYAASELRCRPGDNFISAGAAGTAATSAAAAADGENAAAAAAGRDGRSHEEAPVFLLHMDVLERRGGVVEEADQPGGRAPPSELIREASC